MKLHLRYAHDTPGEVAALYVPSGGPAAWLRALDETGLPAAELELYPVDDRAAVLRWAGGVRPRLGRLSRASVSLQCLGEQLFAPPSAALFPPLMPAELAGAFPSQAGQLILWLPGKEPQRLHRLPAWSSLIAAPAERALELRVPPVAERQSWRLPPIQVAAPPALEEQVLAKADQKPIPFDALRPLSGVELIKMESLETLLKGGKLSQSLARKLAGDRPPQEVLDELRQRDGDELELLRRLYERDPLAAMRCSPPLDTLGTDGAPRDLREVDYRLRRYWSRLSYMTGSRNSGSGAGYAYDNEQFVALQQMYERNATALAKLGKHEEVAFVYLKLMNDPRRAANYLASNGKPLQAAEIYLRKLGDRARAAEEYRAGKAFDKARALFEECNRLEEAGDCAAELGRHDDAEGLYRRRVSQLTQGGKPVAAAELLRSKIADQRGAQELLDWGFRQNEQAALCLSTYLDYLPSLEAGVAYVEALGGELPPKRARQLLVGLTHLRSLYPEGRAELREKGLELAARAAEADARVFRTLSALMDDEAFAREAGQFARR